MRPKWVFNDHHAVPYTRCRHQDEERSKSPCESCAKENDAALRRATVFAEGVNEAVRALLDAAGVAFAEERDEEANRLREAAKLIARDARDWSLI